MSDGRSTTPQGCDCGCKVCGAVCSKVVPPPELRARGHPEMRRSGCASADINPKPSLVALAAAPAARPAARMCSLASSCHSSSALWTR